MRSPTGRRCSARPDTSASDWTTAEPLWTPPFANDVRRAWTKGTVRLEAASLRGKPVWFSVVPDWRQPSEVAYRPPEVGQRVSQVLGNLIQILIIGGGALLARRSIRQGRSDKRGATRFALFYLGLGAAYELVRLSGNPERWFEVFNRNLGRQLFLSALVWVFYVAVEPYVRRLWPGTLVAWSRALEGRLRDPMVGRHILLGALGGLCFSLLFSLPTLASAIAGLPAPRPLANPELLNSTSASFEWAFLALQTSFRIPVSALVGVLLFRVIFRRPWLAYLAIILITGGAIVVGQPSWVQALSTFLALALILVVLTRLGLLAFLFSILFSTWEHFALTIDPSSWFFAQSLVTMACFAGVAVYGFWVSLGTQKVFGDSLLEQ